ncbi:hypothetical protein PMZ80_004630 [Knufia obscura]|uniref:Ribosome biogenesis protein SLX9 n=2 Tax=Knufia TaxID=430999 RepID=A0AAN8I3G5_9EURO|nr:hypothetical protein PMZ80_004630 [Knufia obscura]KAK5952622.1 hypothetical protein OHC33_006214 [Knufia fluminis]
MAPLRPLPGRSAQPPKSILKQKEGSRSAVAKPDSLFATNKKDKQRIKHAQLMSKVTKSSTSKPRRRRPNKKLVTTLDSLADALPDDLEGSGSDKEAAGSTAADQVNIIRRKSMKSRPGAMKRKQKLDNNERDRFAKNLAQMAAPGATSGPTSSAEKLKALRGFISQTLEKRPEVAGVSG